MANFMKVWGVVSENLGSRDSDRQAPMDGFARRRRMGGSEAENHRFSFSAGTVEILLPLTKPAIYCDGDHTVK
ncbi:MAG: hypothetical protein CVV06_09635 [Gammaproteobacteria bacterium HGW-Gammaproteobacteria-10]|nr:MAG: hypothetical protein CVV06_09635 [Gammaproteobacteria bacterium HGW-Gammaproteobacteria-10]HBA64586.1 hypothetical protein [Methylococcaceae bacterium]